MRALTALTAASVAVVTVVAAPAASAAGDGLSNAQLKAVVAMPSLAPTSALGTDVSANGVWLERNMPGALACLSADGEGNGLPDGATAALQGWNYRSGGETFTVGTTVYQYATAAQAKAARAALAARDCPDDAVYKDDDNAPGTPTQQGSDIEGRLHGQQGYSYVFTEKDYGGKKYANVTVLRPIGNAVIATNGVAPLGKTSALEAWARGAAITAVNAYRDATLRYSAATLERYGFVTLDPGDGYNDPAAGYSDVTLTANTARPFQPVTIKGVAPDGTAPGTVLTLQRFHPTEPAAPVSSPTSTRPPPSTPTAPSP